jgi:hypothetical protein
VLRLLGSNILFTRAADALKYIIVLIQYSHSSRLYRETWIKMYKHFLQLFSVYLIQLVPFLSKGKRIHRLIGCSLEKIMLQDKDDDKRK